MYPWYRLVGNEDRLEQGDIIKSCPIIVPPKSELSGDINVDVKEFDVVVMSQSCDLAARKISLVLVCPICTMSELEEAKPDFKSVEMKEKLRQGYVQGLHLLNKSELEGHECEYTVVDFRSVYSVDLEYIEYLAKQGGVRLRLLPPYREHLAQAFSRFFMRVGLPVDIPRFTK